MRPRTNILIVEPSDIVREGLAAILREEDLALLAPLRDAHDLALRLPVLQPDVLLLNPTLLPTPAQPVLAALQQARPNMAVVALVYQYVDPRLLQAFKGVLDIREPRNRVAQLLRDCFQGEAETGEDNYELSEREREVLLLVAQGFSSKEIADKLNISVHTVNTHRKNITHKTGIKSVAGLAVYAMIHNNELPITN